ncbi:hypothetical protein MOTC310_26940 [Methylobacterium oryzae]|uniref:Uncharacterized protein n=1 Tax=Methylobacterium oryzae TaxID=334852 RepID=A0ABU7TX13_9HYPH
MVPIVGGHAAARRLAGRSGPLDAAAYRALIGAGLCRGHVRGAVRAGTAAAVPILQPPRAAR